MSKAGEPLSDTHIGNDEKAALIAHFANLWSLAFAQGHLINARVDMQSGPDAEELQERMTEAAGVLHESSSVLYYHRELLKQTFEHRGVPHLYDRLAQAANFQLFDDAKAEYERTGSLGLAAKYMTEQMLKRAKEAPEAKEAADE